MKDFVQKYRIQKLVKALNTQAPRPKMTSNVTTKPRAATAQANEFPIGTVRNGRMKVSAHPSKWVDVRSGTSHGHHQADEKHGIESHPELTNMYHKTVGKMKRYMNGDQLETGKKLLKDYLEKKFHSKNMETVTNHNMKGRKELSTTDSQTHFRLADEATDAFNKVLKHVEQVKRENASKKKVSA